MFYCNIITRNTLVNCIRKNVYDKNCYRSVVCTSVCVSQSCFQLMLSDGMRRHEPGGETAIASALNFSLSENFLLYLNSFPKIRKL